MKNGTESVFLATQQSPLPNLCSENFNHRSRHCFIYHMTVIITNVKNQESPLTPTSHILAFRQQSTLQPNPTKDVCLKNVVLSIPTSLPTDMNMEKT